MNNQPVSRDFVCSLLLDTACIFGDVYSAVAREDEYSLVADVHGEDVPVLLSESAEVQVDLLFVFQLRDRACR